MTTSRQSDPPRWRRLEPDARREQILVCAIRLFGEKPFASVSTAEIAAEAGVARGLINHYFGTKRELYLEVVRRLVTMPRSAGERAPSGTLRERVDASLDWFLDAVGTHGKTWVAVVGAEGIGADPDVERILAEADAVAAAHVLGAVGQIQAGADRDELEAMIRTYSAMVKAAGREWLVRGTLSRAQVHRLLSNTLVAILRDVST